MKLYEFEGKYLFSRVGIKVPKGVLTTGHVDWKGTAVVKAQVLEGSRGKRGLVKVTDDVNSAIDELKKEGIEKVLVEEFVPHDREIYVSALMDRDTGEPMVIASRHGGIDVESSKDLYKRVIPMERGVMPYDVIAFEKYLEVKGLDAVIKGLYSLVVDYDAELAEINPLAVTSSGLVALDSKVILDDNALYKHEDLLKELGRSYSPDSYVELEGDVGIIGNGAGLTMATMDLVKLLGGNPADFMDVGGGADAERVRYCVEKVGSNPRVKKIIINIYGGITRCDDVARGIVEAYSKVNKPIFVRLVGTNEEEGWKILQGHGIKVYNNALDAVRDALR
ncbi:MAG: succinate--CoA ligase [Candidatus Aramenus sulfurataquae]|jgi:succinyl-CoA synthetase beta subunit|uniref:Succinate--CoA ligase n=2 Tax=Candidatus Aramenus sulfurataquae TaxID=1326980 RepID=W7KWV8_9CREN|nr:MAG: succinate--CoA ligase [Candidatus Aramenus sulfurataquae]MCL7343961.1 succinate--CoA ligase subunit beta [Candidatus Aramenus sulfurataquae]